MGCCSKGNSQNTCNNGNNGGFGLQNSAFLIIVLYILLAIILGGLIF